MSGQRSSLFSRFALTTALLMGAIMVLAALFFHFYRGDFFQQSFNAPLEHWARTIAERRWITNSQTSIRPSLTTAPSVLQRRPGASVRRWIGWGSGLSDNKARSSDGCGRRDSRRRLRLP